MRAILKDFKWELFTHPTCSPDFASCDYHLFLALKDHLGGNHFSSKAELDVEILLFFLKMDPSFYHLGIEKLVLHYNKCLDSLGEYIGK